MARMIDADVASKRFRGWLEGPHEASEYNSGFDDAIYRVLDVIDHMPTLTQPNEPLTCDGCISLGTSYGPCVNCIRSRLRGDMYRRPPEGEGGDVGRG